jgi:hypothetical protein
VAKRKRPRGGPALLLLPPHRKALQATMRGFRELEQRFERGDDVALLLAVLDWLYVSTAPDWVQQRFAERFWAWYFHEFATLDEAFRVKRPQRQRHSERHRRNALRPVIVFLAEQLHAQEGLALGRGGELFERIGDMLGVEARYADGIYYEPASAGCRKVLPYFVKSFKLTIPKSWLAKFGLKPRHAG